MLSVSIVTYHTPLSELDNCLRSIRCPQVVRIYIIDNSRDPKIRDWSLTNPDTIYIANDNTGYGAGHNIALRQELDRADAPYHLVMNSDLVFDPEIISGILRFMESHPDVATLQPRILNPDGTRQFTCRRLPTPFDVFLRRFTPPWLLKGRREKYLLTHLDPHRPWNIPYHQGSFMFMRKDALKESGIFDERFFMYPEDIDLTRRLHRHFATVYWPGASITHMHRAESYHSMRMLRIHIVNMIRYFNKWGWIFDSERRRFNNEIREYHG